jgi:hypothetical protein
MGKSSRVFRPTSFGDEREVELKDFELIDFDTQKISAIPAEFRGLRLPEVLPKWGRDHGFDAMPGNRDLFLSGVTLADLAPSEWERQEPQKLAERLSRNIYMASRLPSGQTTRMPPPSNYAFRTQDGGLGMLQLLTFPEREGSAIFRYKMVVPAHFE